MAQDVTQITDHTTRALARFAFQYRNKPLLSSLVTVFATQIQELETALFGVLLGYRIDQAVGEQLDVIGRVIGQARESATDAEYRLRLAARIRANLSTGSAEDIYTVFGILLPTHTLELTPRYPASFVLDVIEAIDASLVALYSAFLRDTRAGGIGGQGIYALSAPAVMLTLDDAAAPVPDAALGLDDAGAPGAGGHLAGVF